MVLPTYIVLHRSEWERLKRQSEVRVDRLTEGNSSEKYEYLKALTAKSQEWMKHWPDTIAGHEEKLEKQKRKQRKKDIAIVQAFANKHKPDNSAEAIKNARQIIFDRSSYGKKLLSALIESRTLKVRDAQIKFKNKLQDEAIELAKEQNRSKRNDFLNFDDKETERKNMQQIKTLECNRYNHDSVTMKREKQLKLKEKEKQCAVEGDKLMEQILNNEQKIKEELKHINEQALKEYEAERIAIQKVKARNEKLEDDLIQVYKKAQENINCKMEHVLKEMHQGRPESKRSKALFAMIDQIQREKNKCFEEFIDSAINKWEKRNDEKEKQNLEREKEKRLYRCAISQDNKSAGEEAKYANNASCANKCLCDRQTILPKTNRKTLKGCGDKSEEKTIPKKLLFLEPHNKLVEELRMREKEPSPWNGARGVHAQFAQNATAALEDCEHKHLVRKVIDEYRRFNCLDDITLPIPNY